MVSVSTEESNRTTLDENNLNTVTTNAIPNQNGIPHSHGKTIHPKTDDNQISQDRKNDSESEHPFVNCPSKTSKEISPRQGTDTTATHLHVPTASPETSVNPPIPENRRPKKQESRILRMVHRAAGLARQGKAKPIFPDNGLSIIERIFHKSPEGKPQVIMLFGCGLRFSPASTHVSEDRIAELLTMAAAEHHRCCAYVDFETQTTHLLGTNCQEYRIPYRFIAADRLEDVRKRIFMEEVNLTFDVHDKAKPLCRVAIVGPPLMAGKGARWGPNGPIYGQKPQQPVSFDLFMSFHHCLGDGLSMLIFMKTFLRLCTFENLEAESLPMHTFPCQPVPPPLLDNLIRPNLLGVLGQAAMMIFKEFDKSRLKRFKAFFGADSDEPELDFTRPDDYATSPLPKPQIQDGTNNTAGSSSLTRSPIQIVSKAGTITPSEQGQTNSSTPNPAIQLHGLPSTTFVKFLRYNTDFVAELRKSSKARKTTIAAVLIVAALASVRYAFKDVAEKKKKKLPKYQAWVVTNSMRHLLPGSQLLRGADKQTDIALTHFGGYGGSVADSHLRLVGSSNFWERCRTVRRRISSDFFASMRRLKLLNWVYRHPKLYNMVQQRTDLAKLTRGYSVELANLGAWDYPCAPPDAPDQDTRLRADWVQGSLNSSFDGARGIFSIAVLTLGSDMYISISYDKAAISESVAETFTKTFHNALCNAKDLPGNPKIEQIIDAHPEALQLRSPPA